MGLYCPLSNDDLLVSPLACEARGKRDEGKEREGVGGWAIMTRGQKKASS